MFTQCPDCKQQFCIRSDQLLVAAGEVKCGYCGRQFNAKRFLRSHPLPIEIESTQASGSASVASVPQVELSADEMVTEDAPPGTEFTALTREKQTPDDAIPSEIGREALMAFGEPPYEQITSRKSLDDVSTDPERNLEEQGFSRRRAGLFWGLGSICLLVILVLQVGWFFRDQLVTRVPSLTSYLQDLCDHLGCQVARYNRISSIRLVNRDVRKHPYYQESLLVNITMMNVSGKPRPWPQIQLILFDIDGQVISWRRFQPENYLNESIADDTMMAAEIPVHLVLEVVGRTDNAVSFEFDFLEDV